MSEPAPTVDGMTVARSPMFVYDCPDARALADFYAALLGWQVQEETGQDWVDITAADEDGKADAHRKRDAEAEAVADMCARLIGSEKIHDRRTGQARPCRHGDIALLAPTGTRRFLVPAPRCPEIACHLNGAAGSRCMRRAPQPDHSQCFAAIAPVSDASISTARSAIRGSLLASS